MAEKKYILYTWDKKFLMINMKRLIKLKFGWRYKNEILRQKLFDIESFTFVNSSEMEDNSARS